MDEGDGGLVLLADHLYAGGHSRGQRGCHELGRIVGVVDDVDLLRAKVLHDGTHASAAGADQRTLRVHAIGVGLDRDLGAGAGLTSDGHDGHGTGDQFRHFTLEQLADQLRVGAGHHDFRALDATGHVHHVHADAFAVAVTFAGHLLTARQNGFDIAHRDMHVGGVGSILLDDAGDELALLTGERAEYLLIFGAAEQLGDDLACSGGGETAEVTRGVVVFLAQLGSGVRVVLGGLDRDFVGGPDGEIAGTFVKLHTRVPGGVRGLEVGEAQGLCQRIIQGSGVDSLLGGELVYSCQVQFHRSVPPMKLCGAWPMSGHS